MPYVYVDYRKLRMMAPEGSDVRQKIRQAFAKSKDLSTFRRLFLLESPSGKPVRMQDTTLGSRVIKPAKQAGVTIRESEISREAPDEFLGKVGRQIQILAQEAGSAIGKQFMYTAYIPHGQFFGKLVREINRLRPYDSFRALCGSKNYLLKSVVNYLNVFFRAAQKGVRVERGFLGNLQGEFTKEEWQAIRVHQEWQRALKSSVKSWGIVGRQAVDARQEFSLPPGFGIVLIARRRYGTGRYTTCFHHGFIDDQLGWISENRAIYSHLNAILEELGRRADDVNARTNFQKAMRDVGRKDTSIWKTIPRRLIRPP